jgi:hypothetical protein
VTEHPDHSLTYAGPVPGDSALWAHARVTAATRELAAAGLPAPTVFEFPHHAASLTGPIALINRAGPVFVVEEGDAAKLEADVVELRARGAQVVHVGSAERASFPLAGDPQSRWGPLASLIALQHVHAPSPSAEGVTLMGPAASPRPSRSSGGWTGTCGCGPLPRRRRVRPGRGGRR